MIDSHAHLEDLPDPKEALGRAFEAGVEAVLAVAMDRAAGELALELAAWDQRVWPALGLHPWRVAPETWREEIKFVAENLHRCRALGEAGLDYKKKVPKKLQWQALQAQLELAAEQGLAASVHCRLSEPRVLAMLTRAGVTGVFHWFAAPPEFLRQVLADGHYISATPAVATSPPHRLAVASCPLSRLLLETDTPVPHGGRPCQPDRVLETCRLVAELKGISPREVARETTRNARALFAGGPPAA